MQSEREARAALSLRQTPESERASGEDKLYLAPWLHLRAREADLPYTVPLRKKRSAANGNKSGSNGNRSGSNGDRLNRLFSEKAARVEKIRRDYKPRPLKVVNRGRPADYGKYLKSAHWLELRARVLRERGQRCEGCGVRWPLNVHHLTYASLGSERMQELVVLCRACHEGRHGIESR